MQRKLNIGKNGATDYEGMHEVIDAETFGRAFADVWPRCKDGGCRRAPAS